MVNTMHSKKMKKAAIETLGTEQRILNAARQEFIATGLRGARMQSIADRAGVNKALLHYYFRSKEKLYEETIKEIATALWGALDKQLKDKEFGSDIMFLVRTFVSTVVKTMGSNPDFPRMMLREIADGGEHFGMLVAGIVGKYGNLQQMLLRTLASEMEKGTIKRMDPIHYIMNILGMCISAFFMRPLIEKAGTVLPLRIKYDDRFYNQRIESIIELLRGGIFAKGSRNG